MEKRTERNRKLQWVWHPAIVNFVLWNVGVAVLWVYAVNHGVQIISSHGLQWWSLKTTVRSAVLITDGQSRYKKRQTGSPFWGESDANRQGGMLRARLTVTQALWEDTEVLTDWRRLHRTGNTWNDCWRVERMEKGRDWSGTEVSTPTWYTWAEDRAAAWSRAAVEDIQWVCFTLPKNPVAGAHHHLPRTPPKLLFSIHEMSPGHISRQSPPVTLMLCW